LAVVPDALFPLFAESILLPLFAESILRESIMKKFLVALLTVIALSGAVGAVLVAYPTSAAAAPPDPCIW
jgi:hypothetical protein